MYSVGFETLKEERREMSEVGKDLDEAEAAPRRQGDEALEIFAERRLATDELDTGAAEFGCLLNHRLVAVASHVTVLRLVRPRTGVTVDTLEITEVGQLDPEEPEAFRKRRGDGSATAVQHEMFLVKLRRLPKLVIGIL